MSKSLGERISFAKIVIVLAVSFVLGLGLCGLDATLLARFRTIHEEFGPNTVIGSIGAFAVLLSGLGLVCVTIAWAVTAAVGGFRSKNAAPQKLFGDEEKTKHREDETKRDDQG